MTALKLLERRLYDNPEKDPRFAPADQRQIDSLRGNSPVTPLLPFRREELQKALEVGNEDGSGLYFDIDYANLVEAFEAIFGGHKVLPKEIYHKVIEGNYEMDLEEHGLLNLPLDLELIVNFFTQAVRNVRNSTSNVSNEALVVGCGPGREAIPVIELSRMLGIERVVFNDLLPHHIEHTREKIAEVYNTRAQEVNSVQVDFAQGDICAVQLQSRFDVIMAMWFVTSEICDFSSVDAIRETRHTFYTKINTLLTEAGVFIEDLPFNGAKESYYHNGQLKTFDILSKHGVLPGESHNMLLSNFSNIQDEGFPFHIRYLPSNGSHRREMERAGFRENFHDKTILPIGCSNITLFRDTLGDDFKIRDLFLNHRSFGSLRKQLETIKARSLMFPENPLLQKQKKTILWEKV